jgi:hypothetical protein
MVLAVVTVFFYLSFSQMVSPLPTATGKACPGQSDGGPCPSVEHF